MRGNAIVCVIAAALWLSGATTVEAQPGPGWRGSGGWGMGAQYQRMFDPGTVETVAGEVTSVDQMVPRKGMSSGIHLKLKTEKGTLPVHLGPAWYIERLDTKIEKGDKLSIKGSRVTFEGKPAIIAAEVAKGDSVLVLRDASGVPAWAGWRKR
jgi:hypothetical protein